MTFDWQKTGIYKRFIDELSDYCSTHPSIEKLMLFGSRARGDFQQTSDIDLAIYTRNATHTEQHLIEQTIQEMVTPLKIDVVFTDRLTNEQLISNILQEGLVAYEQGEALRKA